MTVPMNVRAEVKAELWRLADDMEWDAMSSADKVRRSFGTAFGPRFIIFSWRNDRLVVRAVFGIVSCVTACFGPCELPSIDQHCIELTNQFVFIQHHVKTELLGGIPLVWSSAGRPSEIPTLLPNLTLDVIKLKSCEIRSLRQDSVPARLTSLTAIQDNTLDEIPLRVQAIENGIKRLAVIRVPFRPTSRATSPTVKNEMSILDFD